MKKKINAKIKAKRESRKEKKQIKKTDTCHLARDSFPEPKL